MAVLVLINFTGKGQPQNKSDTKNGYDDKNDVIQSKSSVKLFLKSLGRPPIDRPLKEAHRCERACLQRHPRDTYRHY